jgi:hypothetical protein
MLTRSPNAPAALGQRAVAQRRLRRSAASRHLFCSTNGCPTFMDVDATGQVATCHICGNSRQLSARATNEVRTSTN